MMEGMKNLHRDVLLAMANALTGQFHSGVISEVDYGAQLAPIITELYDRQDARLRDIEAEFKQLKMDQAETLKTNAMIIDIYDEFLSMKGLEEEFEEFEHSWMLKHEQEGAGQDGPQ